MIPRGMSCTRDNVEHIADLLTFDPLDLAARSPNVGPSLTCPGMNGIGTCRLCLSATIGFARGLPPGRLRSTKLRRAGYLKHHAIPNLCPKNLGD
jgi:hypothetical protein